jgi:transposase
VKGQGKFIVVLVDLETHKLVGLVSERKQSKIKETMKEWGNDVLLQINVGTKHLRNSMNG